VASYLVGGSLLGAGLVLLYLNRPRLVERGGGPIAGRMEIVPTVSTDMFGALIEISR
jgi:hypothetical protein